MRTLRPIEKNIMLWDQDFLSDSWNNFFSDFGRFENTQFMPQYLKNTFEPTCDITEAKDHFMITLDVPGVDKNDLSIDVDNNKLVITGERRSEAKSEEGLKTLHFERSFGKFVRTFNLSSDVNKDEIQAHHQDGVLKVAIPKTKKAEAKKIAIGTDKPSFFQKLVSPLKTEQ